MADIVPLSLLLPDPGPAPDPQYVREYYACELTRPRASTLRLQLYEIQPGMQGKPKLRQLWPADAHHGRRALLLPFQVFSMHEGYPSYHFKIERGYAEPLRVVAGELAKHYRCRVLIIPLGAASLTMAVGDGAP
jgi:hypothetical protein